MDEERGVPSEADQDWWASQNTDWHSDQAEDEDDEDFDHRADVAEVMSMMERGLWPY